MIAYYFKIGGGYSADRDLLSADWRQLNVETGLRPSEVVSLFNKVENLRMKKKKTIGR